MALLLFAFTSAASADQRIGETGEGAGQTQDPHGLATDFETGRLYVADSGNHRIDAFDSEGHFEMAFGWGVADGSPELQRCGPKATPPTAKCRKGLVGGGAGEFTNLGDIAVDNDPASPSQGDVYVLDERSIAEEEHDYRVQKFDPAGNFLLTFGGGVVAGGAEGSGNLVKGSAQVTSVKTTSRAFEVAQTITGPGIPAGTTIIGVSNGTITLSKVATAAGTGVSLSVATGSGNKPANQVDTLLNRGTGSPNVRVRIADPTPSETELGRSLLYTANAAELQAALEALPNVGAGNVKVTCTVATCKVNEGGEEEHEYTVEFIGTRFADTKVTMLPGNDIGNRQVFRIQNGGGGVEVCTAAIATSCSGGVEGTGHGQFAGGPGGIGIHLALGVEGDVYIVDCPTVTQEVRCEARLQKFDGLGAFVEELALPQLQRWPGGIAVDSSGSFYVSADAEILKYDSSGSLIGQLSAGKNIGRLAIDASDDLFALEADGENPVIAEYDPSGNTMRRFGYEVLKETAGLAPEQASSDGVYVAESGSILGGVFERSFPPLGPVIVPRTCATSFLGNAKATLVAEVNPEGQATTTHFEYISDADFVANGNSFVGSHPAAATDESPSIGSDFFVHDIEAEASLVPETKYHCRVVATSSDAPGGAVGPEGSFTSLAPLEIGSTTASKVSTEAATLNAQVNPLGIPATGFFEYVEEAVYQKDISELGPEHGFDHAIEAPAVDGAQDPITFGSSEDFTLGSIAVSGLEPGTSYRFRLVATDIRISPEGKEVVGPTKAFRTYGSREVALPDGRGLELVSPPQKNSAEVAVPGPAGGLFEDRTIRIQAAARSGEAITYTSFSSFGDAQSAPAASQYLSRRTPQGWTTANVSPLGIQALALFPPYRGFSDDLGFGAATVRQPALTADCPEGFEDFYLFNTVKGTPSCLTPEAPEIVNGGRDFCFRLAGTSRDGSHAFFAARAYYPGQIAPKENEKGNGFNLYEWSATGGLKAVSVLPGQSEAVPATLRSSFGAGVPTGDACNFAQSILRNVISADGSKAFWTHVPEGEGSTGELLARLDGNETIQLDALPKDQKVEKPGPGPAGGGVFWAASADGSVVYFTDANRLIKGSKAEAGASDLYRYELGQGEPLSDLTKASTTGTPADVQGVVGASDDGSHVYFVAKGVLSENENSSGSKAQAGKDNLYLFHAGETRFIAALSNQDARDWESQPKALSARVSPDGLHLAFLSTETEVLAGYDNAVARGEHCQWVPGSGLEGGPLCPQAFLYDAGTGKLSCASCNPSGARPLGPALLPGWTNSFEGPHYLSDDGRHLFYESFDALTTADENEKRDVYEFERPGAGSCTSDSPAFDPASGGCHYLISSGHDSDESYLVDASASGRDVFVSTRSRLTGWDADENYDVYDAREGGGFLEPAERPGCTGEACKPPASSPPAVASPPSFEGLGNPPRHVKKHGKKSHRKKAKKHAKGATKTGHKRGVKR